MEPDACEDQTEPRIRMPLLIPPEHSGVVPRAKSALTQAQRGVWRLRFAPALFIGTVLGSAPYLVHQHLQGHSVDDLRTLARAADVETTQLAAATAAASVAPQPEQAQREPALEDAALLPSAPQPIAAPSYMKLAPEPQVHTAYHGSKLTLERALLGLARRQLKSGDGMGAQLVLERLDKSVPHGAQLQQRKWLEIQALLAIGAKDRARAAARDFAKAYPHSPKLAKLAGLLLGS
jgi:hypothetical protein